MWAAQYCVHLFTSKSYNDKPSGKAASFEDIEKP
jgi:hypothetical protein